MGTEVRIVGPESEGVLRAIFNRRALFLRRTEGMEIPADGEALARATQRFKEELFLAAHARRRRVLACAALLCSGKGPQGEKTALTWEPFLCFVDFNEIGF